MEKSLLYENSRIVSKTIQEKANYIINSMNANTQLTLSRSTLKLHNFMARLSLSQNLLKFLA